jgi:hypothetical protein
MVLKRVRAGRHYDYVGKFACATCNRTVTQTLELTSSPPLAPVPGEQDLADHKISNAVISRPSEAR